MNARSSLTRLFALRRLQEERLEAELRAERQQREAYLAAAERSQMETKTIAQELFTALVAGERDYVVAAGIGGALGPLRQRLIEQRLLTAEALVGEAKQRWHEARVERLQVESVLAGQQRRERTEREAKEQKSMDGWFLTRRAMADEERADAVDESSQRLQQAGGPLDGMTSAWSRFR